MENWGEGGGGQLTKTVPHTFAGKTHMILIRKSHIAKNRNWSVSNLRKLFLTQLLKESKIMFFLQIWM
jgi:hypothetical protein